MRLTELFVPETVVTDFPAAPAEQLLDAMVCDLDGKGLVANRERALADLIARERVMSTGVGHGVAIPHAYTDGVDRMIAGVYRTAEGISFGAPDDVDVSVFFIILGPRQRRRDHIRVLAKISRLLHHAEFRDSMRTARDPGAVIGVLKRFGDR